MKNHLSIETICAVFCKHNHTSPIDLYSTNRERPIAETRRMIWGYLRGNTQMTWKALGELFGRDHSTAMYAVSKHKMHISVSPRGMRYDVGYSDKYMAAVIELDGEYSDEYIAAAREVEKLTEIAKEKQLYIRSYMLTYYCPSTDRYIAPVVKATSLREAIQEYESYIPITNEELVIAKAL
jgi:hypothetical protein